MEGRDIRTANITTATTLAGVVRPTLGPDGLDKMMIDPDGNVIVTNDGLRILNEMDFEMEIVPAAADAIVEAANEQDAAVGDATTALIVLAGELLGEAEQLLDDGLHPTTVADGYQRAAAEACSVIEETALPITDDDTLVRLARTTMESKALVSSVSFAELIVRAVRAVEEDGRVDTDELKIERAPGGAFGESALYQGVVVGKPRHRPSMPQRVEDARIALIDDDIKLREILPDEAQATIDTAAQHRAFLDAENAQRHAIVDRYADLGVDVLFCMKMVDDDVMDYLSKQGIYVVYRPGKDDFESLARATGANIVGKFHALEADDLGYAGTVRETRVGHEKVTMVEECANPKTVTLVLRGGTQHVIEEIERVVRDAIGVIATAVRHESVVPGGGAIEVALARHLDDYARTLPGREQFAVEAFSEALTAIPWTLAQNRGLDPVETLIEIRSRQADGNPNVGLDAATGEVTDMAEHGIIEPAMAKHRALVGASETAAGILRIDDLIPARTPELESKEAADQAVREEAGVTE